ncbi:MAG: CBS domain-containing protein [Acidobacteria bacterium]|nr:CBS domain-containing protein [Acidobacteriota bacterium]
MVQALTEVMTPAPRCLDSSDTAADAARLMREDDIGDVFVCVDGRLHGIVTDRDLVVRALADAQRDPRQVRLADISSTDLTVLAPDDTVDEAVELMRERAIRRLPICENGRPVGVVSIGDLAIARDSASALADISMAPANA